FGRNASAPECGVLRLIVGIAAELLALELEAVDRVADAAREVVDRRTGALRRGAELLRRTLGRRCRLRQGQEVIVGRLELAAVNGQAQGGDVRHARLLTTRRRWPTEPMIDFRPAPSCAAAISTAPPSGTAAVLATGLRNASSTASMTSIS